MDYTAGCHTHFPRLHFDFSPIWSRPEWPAKWISAPLTHGCSNGTCDPCHNFRYEQCSGIWGGVTGLELTGLMLLLHIKHIRTFETKGMNIKPLHLNTSVNFTQLQITGWKKTHLRTPQGEGIVKKKRKQKKSPMTSDSYLSLHKIKEITLPPRLIGQYITRHFKAGTETKQPLMPPGPSWPRPWAEQAGITGTHDTLPLPFPAIHSNPTLYTLAPDPPPSSWPNCQTKHLAFVWEGRQFHSQCQAVSWPAFMHTHSLTHTHEEDIHNFTQTQPSSQWKPHRNYNVKWA